MSPAMRGVAILLVLVAVGLLAASGLCAPVGDCVNSLAHAQFLGPAVSASTFLPDITGALGPLSVARYSSIAVPPLSPPPRA